MTDGSNISAGRPEVLREDYNTTRDRLIMPEHGRNVQKLVLKILEIEDDERRRESLSAIVGVMRSLDAQGKDSSKDSQEANQKYWDHIYEISGFTLKEGDSPYPAPVRSVDKGKPEPVTRPDTPVRATHYGRNIEKMIDTISLMPEGGEKVELVRALATYMRQQYLIWNKDNVADETIFNDIFKLSGGKLVVPQSVSLAKLDLNMSYAKPGAVTAAKQQGKNAGGKAQRKNKMQAMKKRNG